jgi:hypothetical protein
VSFFVRYTPVYWITWVLLIGALVPLALEEMTASKIRQGGAVPEGDDYGQKFRSGDESVRPSGNDPQHP